MSRHRVTEFKLVPRVSPARLGCGVSAQTGVCDQSAPANLAIEAPEYRLICPISVVSPSRSWNRAAAVVFFTILIYPSLSYCPWHQAK